MNQKDKDKEHLRILSIVYYVLAGLTALFSLIPIIHVIMGIVMLTVPGSEDVKTVHGPEGMGWFFIIIGGSIIFLGEALALVMFLSGRALARCKHYVFSFVIAVLSCLMIPYGTALGIFTIIVLTRDSVKRLYGRS